MDCAGLKCRLAFSGWLLDATNEPAGVSTQHGQVGKKKKMIFCVTATSQKKTTSRHFQNKRGVVTHKVFI
jgi:hypothetical protein